MTRYLRLSALSNFGDTVSFTYDENAEQRWVGSLGAKIQGLQDSLQEWRQDFRAVSDRVAQQDVGMAEIVASMKSLRETVIRAEQDSADKAEVAALRTQIDRNTQDVTEARAAASAQAKAFVELANENAALETDISNVQEAQKKVFRWGGAVLGAIVITILSNGGLPGVTAQPPRPATMQVSSSPTSVSVSSVSSVAPHSPSSGGLKIIGDLMKGLVPK